MKVPSLLVPCIGRIRWHEFDAAGGRGRIRTRDSRLRRPVPYPG
jgi:hypothetical protein